MTSINSTLNSVQNGFVKNSASNVSQNYPQAKVPVQKDEYKTTNPVKKAFLGSLGLSTIVGAIALPMMDDASSLLKGLKGADKIKMLALSAGFGGLSGLAFGAIFVALPVTLIAALINSGEKKVKA